MSFPGTGRISDVNVSFDRRTVAVLNRTGVIHLYGLTDGKIEDGPQLAAGNVVSYALDEHGSSIATIDKDGNLTVSGLIDKHFSELFRTTVRGKIILKLSIINDSLVVIYSDSLMEAWSIKELGPPIITKLVNQTPNAFDLSEPEQIVASVSAQGSLSIVRAEDGEVLATRQFDRDVLCFTFEKGSHHLLVGLSDGQIWRWNGDWARIYGPSQQGGIAFAVGQSPGSLLAFAAGVSPQTISFIDPRSGQVDDFVAGFGETFKSAEFNDQGNQFAVTADDGSISLYDFSSSSRFYELSPERGGLTSVVYSHTGDTFVTTSKGGMPGNEGRVSHGSTQLWRLEGGRPVLVADLLSGQDSIDEKWWFSIAAQADVSRDDNLLVVAIVSGPIEIWDLKAKALVKTIQWPASTCRKTWQHGCLVGVKFDSQAKRVAAASDDGIVRIFDVDTSSIIAEFREEGVRVSAIGFLPGNDDTLVSVAVDGKIRIHSVVNKATRTIQTGEKLLSMTFDTTGDRALLGCADGTARLIDLANGAELRRFSGHGEGINGAVFSPGDKWVATASDDGTVRLWDPESGNTFDRIDLRDKIYLRGNVTGISIDPVNGTIVASTSEGKVFAWTGSSDLRLVDVRQAVSAIRARMKRSPWGSATPSGSKVQGADGLRARPEIG